jgi:hypothetical protein
MVEKERLIERMSKELIGAVHQAVGLASICWSDTDGAGTYDAKKVKNIAVELCYMIADEIEAERDEAAGCIETTINEKDRSRMSLGAVVIYDE